MKSGRQRRIAQLLRNHQITSQNQLVKMLRESGHAATQATVSRDLDDLGAVKVRDEGKVTYVLPAQLGSAPSGDALRRLLTDSVSSVEASGNLVVITTPPGHAGMVASGLDGSEIEGVLGTVAGDDTVLVICKQGVNGRSVERRLRGLADSLEEVS